MRAFACGTCRSLVFFDNDRCLTCGSSLAYDRGRQDLVVVAADEPRRCANRVIANCNWLLDDGPSAVATGSAGGRLCGSCALTRTRPADDDLAGMAAFALAEGAKRRLVYQLDHIGLPTTPRAVDPEHGLAFDLLSSVAEPVTTGHASGVVTIDLAEGDDPHREALRVQLAEPYRTMLGHLRHEIGHWYWDVLVDGTPFLDRFRELFGNEQRDYAEALQEHYGKPPGIDWMDTHVSHYAAAHPWEDWAETFAHYLHIRDTTETAAAWGVRVGGPDLDLSLASNANLDVEPDEHVATFEELAQSWIALEMALNALNRSMGKDDLYPFRLTPAVLTKMRFVHVVVTSVR
ncbi:putative zinc-binding metallopeptidase [uncultured Jatrophihabitans sp.]|uniref:zinc-binding metallopeptidase family protein n=1 Tax=uncultured Jatrophihabitans sp. TaxID=1610747 RepID=UPI0035CA85C8